MEFLQNHHAVNTSESPYTLGTGESWDSQYLTTMITHKHNHEDSHKNNHKDEKQKRNDVA